MATADLPAPCATAVIVAAGSGTRIGDPAKVMLPLAGRPLIAHALDAADAASTVADIVVVAGTHTLGPIESLVERGGWRKVRRVVLGGVRRQDSVEAGLLATDPTADVVAVHDGARPLVTPALFDACVAAARLHGAAIAAIPVADTLKRVRDGLIAETIARDALWAAQTPQAARRDLLVAAFAAAHRLGLQVTDEAGLLEAAGIAVAVVPGLPANFKITHGDDLRLAEVLRGQSWTDERPA